ncbi:hypothetical protein [Providencia phage PSTRCR_120]|uniref:Uncharacterized protein n=1 Tax=Providencia phage PSTRCR_120 TaxID=2800826 RepID=A0A7T6ZLX8_9CAUD|nr:hypothetical protein [Providencia phage PSTRCR_120]
MDWKEIRELSLPFMVLFMGILIGVLYVNA